MNLDDRHIAQVWNRTWMEDVPIALDRSSCSFLWHSKDLGNIVWGGRCIPALVGEGEQVFVWLCIL